MVSPLHGEISQFGPQPTVAESATSWSKDGFGPSQMLGVELPQPYERSTVGGTRVRIGHQARFAHWHRDCICRPADQGAKAMDEGNGADPGGQIAVYHARASRPQALFHRRDEYVQGKLTILLFRLNRAALVRDGSFMRFQTLRPNRDGAHGKK
jgi:hypothetical protein